MEEDLIEIPDEYLLALGTLVNNSARLEQYLNTLIGKIAGFNDLTDPYSIYNGQSCKCFTKSRYS